MSYKQEVKVFSLVYGYINRKQSIRSKKKIHTVIIKIQISRNTMILLLKIKIKIAEMFGSKILIKKNLSVIESLTT